MMHNSTFLVFFCFFSWICFAAGDNKVSGEWKASVQKKNITPQKPVWMAGYASRKGRSEGIRQDIYAKVLTLEDANRNKLVIVTLDLIGVRKTLRRELEEYCLSKHKIPAGSLLINASHTHSGPMIRTYKPRGKGGKEQVISTNIPEEEHDKVLKEIQAYNEELRNKIETMIDRSIVSLLPVKILYGQARCGFSMNRRLPLENGNFRNFPNPDGVVDQTVTTLQVLDKSGKALKAVLFGYACHATTMGDSFIHGDWPGFAQQIFEKDHPGSTVLFLNGCSGDQNPYPRRKEEYLERHGRSMATAIEAALSVKQMPISGSLQTAIAWPEIPYSNIPTKKELLERSKSKNKYELRYAEALLEELKLSGQLAKSYKVPVQVIRLGDSLSFITIGGEVVIDYAFRLKKEISRKTKGKIWIAGYSNDFMCYIPSHRVLMEGGYEGKSSMRYVRSTVHSSTWSSEIEETIVGKIHYLFDQFKEK